VTSLDWESYPILRFPQIPELVYDLIDRPNERPWGAGEPAAAVVPSAISNAVFDAIGVRLRSVPFRPDKVTAAVKGAAGSTVPSSLDLNPLRPKSVFSRLRPL